MSAKSWMLPLLLSFGGVVSDYITTIVGLSIGFHETNQQYHPAWALLYYWSAITILVVTLPRKKISILSVNTLALTSYLGALNNILVILGMFPRIGI